MKFENLFTSSSALELARDLAERQYTMSPAQVIQRLVRFGAIGAASILVIVVAIVGIRSSLGNDANTREVLFFASFMGALVFVSAGGAALVTLWDGFMGRIFINSVT